MAKFEVRGIGDVISAFESIASIPSSVMKEILNTQADVVTVAQQRAAPRNMGTLSASIKKKSPRITYDGGYIMVAPEGIHHSNKSGRSRYRNRGGRSRGETRNAEVAFIHEYGAPGRNIPGQQWMLRANNNCEAATTAAGEKEFFDWLASRGL